MKAKRLLPIMIGALTAMSLAACSDSDDDISASSLPAEVSTTFKSMYPKAQGVEWERNMQYYVADFNQNTFDTEAWFYSNGDWAMTETDYGSLVSMLPIEVQDTFNDSQYVDWIVDDAKYFNRSVSESFCIIEVETQGMPEISLFYDTFGNLVNKVQGDNYNISPTTDITAISWQ